MVTAKTQYRLSNAQDYFEKHLVVGDYYEQGQIVTGEWVGQGAQKLGLNGKIGAERFLALCENRHPSTNTNLTQRQRISREAGGASTVDRRIFYDFTVSPPKSVSIAALVADDQKIIESHHRALRVALREFEAFAATRVRKAGSDTDRLTSNMVAALFTHDTSRALDPHLHTHCIVFNATFDPVEKRWKALQNHEMFRARKYAENVYYHELAKDLGNLGYRIRNHRRGDFEIEGIASDLCERFSKRHGQIDQALQRLLSEKPELRVGNLKDLREHLAEAERSRKMANVSGEDLRRLWRGQLTDTEWTELDRIRVNQCRNQRLQAATELKEAIQWAEDHLFDRHSVVAEFQIWQAVLEKLRGEAVAVGDLKSATWQRGYLRDGSQPGDVTLQSVLDREAEIVRAAKEGVCACRPFVESLPPLNPKLDDEQRIALGRLLQSTNFISLFRGGAGTGKTFVLRELVEHLRRERHEVCVLAPQRQQVVDLEKAGFPAPNTVASFLLRKEQPQRRMVVVDEAGQIGGKQMAELIAIVQSNGGRLILSGDTRQHGPVEASDALIAIERFSGVEPAEIHDIRRQNPNLAKDLAERQAITAYRSAVGDAAEGKLAESFDRLDQMGAVVECGFGDQTERLASEYVLLTEQDASVVVVSQTWAEVHRINQRVREGLKDKGKLGPKDTTVTALEKIDLTAAQKRDARFHEPNSVIVFNQKVRSVQPGSVGKLGGIVKCGLLVEVRGEFITVENRHLDKINICRRVNIPISNGERLLLKANRKLADGKRATNGELVMVKEARNDGTLELQDGRLLDSSYREFLPGYAVTSYGSQGKTVDFILFSDATVKAATNAQQWYVSISRGRRGIRIFTSDKAQLRENVRRSGHRPLALDLAPTAASPRPEVNPWMRRIANHLQRFGERAAKTFIRARQAARFRRNQKYRHEHQIHRVLGHRPAGTRITH